MHMCLIKGEYGKELKQCLKKYNVVGSFIFVFIIGFVKNILSRKPRPSSALMLTRKVGLFVYLLKVIYSRQFDKIYNKATYIPKKCISKIQDIIIIPYFE